jgi:hypothetical protein
MSKRKRDGYAYLTIALIWLIVAIADGGHRAVWAAFACLFAMLGLAMLRAAPSPGRTRRDG